jgi:hypothetical protein
LACLFLEAERDFRNARTPKKIVTSSSSVAQKINTIEERRKNPNLFRQGNYWNKGHNHEKFVPGSSSCEDVFFGLKLGRVKKEQLQAELHAYVKLRQEKLSRKC